MNASIVENSWGKIVWMTLIFGGIWIFIPFISNDFSLGNQALLSGLKKMLGIAILITINIKFLLPHFYFKDKVVEYILIGILSTILIYIALEFFIDPLLERSRVINDWKGKQNRKIEGINWYQNFNRTMPYLLALVASTVVEISSFANKQTQEAILLKSEKLETEMKLLKSQINPHFLFNALNNIYSLSYLKPEKTPDNLLKLSEMLRYMLYECNEDRVLLSKEITYLDNFIHLKLLKDSRGMNITTDIDRSKGHLNIAPMLLIPFVENAFKHGNVEDLDNGWINIVLKVENEKLLFKVENSKPTKQSSKDEVGGIGLPNVKRQLTLLYSNEHSLDIKETATQHTAYLEIKLT